VSDERRVHPRFAVNLMVTLTSGTTVELAAENLSIGGLFVATDDPPCAAGDKVTVSIKLPAGDSESTTLDLPCEVMHVVPPLGMGLRFALADDASRDALQAYLDRLAQVQAELG
jgi:hypothetical protein